MRRIYLSLIPTAAAAAVVLASCGSGGEANTITTPLPSISAGGEIFRTIPTIPTTVTNPVQVGVDPAIDGDPAASADTYTIQPGDFWFKLQELYGCEWQVIADFNDEPLDTSKFPPIGKVLNIPVGDCPGGGAVAEAPAGDPTAAADTTAAPATTSADGSIPYEVTGSDTLFGISQAFDVSMADIMAVNGYSGDPNKFPLWPGKVIKIPAPQAPA